MKLISMKILFMDKVLLSEMRQPVRGVEIFNLRLIRDLCSIGDEITVPVHHSWVDRIAGERVGCAVILPVGLGSKSLLNGLRAAFLLRKSVFDVLLLANVANGLLPAIDLLRRFKVVSRCVLVAHREPSARFLRQQKRLPTRVVSVNSVIAREFSDEGGYELSDVYYGVTDADRFRPAETGNDGTVRFCVLGQLDNAWKGADTAVEAFKLFRQECAVPSELHLASMSNPEPWEGEGIFVHRWMPASDIPNFLNGMNVIVVPSRDENVMRETFSQAIVQGMLSGLPVIASDLPVLTEKLDEGGGRTFKSAQELADIMKTFAEDSGLREKLGRESRTTALTRYVWNTSVFREKYLA